MSSVTRIQGFGVTALFALGLIFASLEEGSRVQLNDARGRILTAAEEICMSNPNLLNKLMGETGVMIQ